MLSVFVVAAVSIVFLVTKADPVPQFIFKLPNESNLRPSNLGHLWRFEVGNATNDVLTQILSHVEEHDLDVWQVTPFYLDVYSPPSAPHLPPPLKAFSHSLLANVTTPDPPRVMSSPGEWNLSSLGGTTYHSDYHPLYETERFMSELQSLHPDMVRIHELGHTGLGREMYGLEISSRSASNGTTERRKRKKSSLSRIDAKYAIVLVGAQHAREWIATATALYLSHALVANKTEPYSLSHLLSDFNFYIVPSPNPDGYDYTWESDRFWYKTRQKVGPKGTCFGLDMNRNWGYKWRTSGHRTWQKLLKFRSDPCSHWFPGHRPFESPEVNNIANWVTAIPNVIGFLDLRSYGQMLSIPFSYSCKAMPDDVEDQLEAALGAVRAIKDEHGMTYATGRLCQNLYKAPGNIVDWMYKRMKIKYSYVLHLRDTGTHGFVLPPSWIRPVGEETGVMLEYLAKFISERR